MLTHQTHLGVGRSPKLLILVSLTIRGDEVSLAPHGLHAAKWGVLNPELLFSYTRQG